MSYVNLIKIRRTYAVFLTYLAFGIAAEFLVYRDNLTLNILMLVTPIDAVREWQIAR